MIVALSAVQMVQGELKMQVKCLKQYAAGCEKLQESMLNLFEVALDAEMSMCFYVKPTLPEWILVQGSDEPSRARNLGKELRSSKDDHQGQDDQNHRALASCWSQCGGNWVCYYVCTAGGRRLNRELAETADVAIVKAAVVARVGTLRQAFMAKEETCGGDTVCEKAGNSMTFDIKFE